MAQPQHQSQQRPPYPQQTQPFGGYPQQNVRHFSPQSPAGSIPYASPSPQPQQFSPTFNAQAPPAKRPRLDSPDGPRPFPQAVGTPQAGSPVNGQVNGVAQVHTPLRAPGSMPPPQQPVIKKEQQDGDVNMFNDTTPFDFGGDSGTVSFSSTTFTSSPNQNQHSPFTSGPVSFNTNDTSFRPGSSNSHLAGGPPPQPTISQEERDLRDHQRKDWEEARHAQHELWDPFLYGATLNDKIKSISHKSNLVEPQSGVLVNTQRNQPPPVVRVNGLEGATRIISQGQSILDTREKADRLNELVKLLSLSSKARITGLLQSAARLALERRQNSQGRIPVEWSDIAIAAKPNGESEPQNTSSPAANAGMKRTYSQANGESGSQPDLTPPIHPAAADFDKSSAKEARAEEARRAKRRKRNEVITAQEKEANDAAEQEALAQAALDSEKKTTKKERKMAELKMTEQQQTASANEAARMATANLFGSFGGRNKKKNYSWLAGAGGGSGGGGGGGGGTGSGAPSRAPSAAATPKRVASEAAIPSLNKAPAAQRRSGVGQFDETTETGIQARDLLLVLESDGRAAQAFVKGSSILDLDTATRAVD